MSIVTLVVFGTDVAFFAVLLVVSKVATFASPPVAFSTSFSFVPPVVAITIVFAFPPVAV